MLVYREKRKEKVMNLEDQFRLYVGAYYGISEMDEYDLKVYILKDIENIIRDFVKTYPLTSFSYQKEALKLEKLSLKRKLQDSLIVLNQMNAPLELVLLVRARLKELASI